MAQASCMHKVTSQSIAEQQTDPKRRFVTLHNSHINASTSRLNFDGTLAEFNENSCCGIVGYFWKAAFAVTDALLCLLSLSLTQMRFNYF
jgi:hypothetical protein